MTTFSANKTEEQAMHKSIRLKSVLFCSTIAACFSCGRQEYLSPGAVAVDDARQLAYTALTTARAVAVTDLLATGRTTRRIALERNPHSLLLSPDGGTLFVSCGEAGGSVEVFALPEGKRVNAIAVGHTPQGLALSADGRTLYAANRFDNSISVIDVQRGKEVSVIPAVREPHVLCLTPDGTTLAVANFLPAQASTADTVAAQITLIDVASNTVRTHLTLPNGAQSLWGLDCSADGRYLYGVHLISRYGVPITQLDRGWVNTHALSVVDLTADSVYATLLLDDVNRGAANPAGVCTGADGHLYITLAGIHELLAIDLKAMHKRLDAFFSEEPAEGVRNRADLSASLSFAAPFKRRICLQGRSPRAVVATGGTLLVSSRFSTFLEQVSINSLSPAWNDVAANRTDVNTSRADISTDRAGVSASRVGISASWAGVSADRAGISANRAGISANRAGVSASRAGVSASRAGVSASRAGVSASRAGVSASRLLPLGKEPAPDAVRRGEQAFCDASICYQGWQSCVSCHPDGRADGLNWDQQNDGLGNPKNTKSLLFSHVTPPAMITGIRKDAETAVRNGILHTLGTRQPESLAADMDAYLRQLRPMESPFLREYRAKDPEERGKALYDRADCSRCHNGAYLTDRQKYDAGTGTGHDQGVLFDTPTLREIWRTAPYLYDGRAATLREVFTSANPDDLHGVTQGLTEQELDALILYIQTL
jgi:YVTN family beta-propeller protein